MDLAILSRDPALYSTSRLLDTARGRGHLVRVVDYLHCSTGVGGAAPEVVYRGESLHPRAVVPRIGASHTFYGTAVVRQFEMMGVHTANGSDAIVRSRDKLHALQLLARAGVGLPVTGFAHATQDIGSLLDLVGGPPVVVKLLEGTQGVGVVLAETGRAAEAVITAFRQLDANFLVQEYVAEAQGSDIRALVVDGKVVAAMRRRGAPGEFRSNLHRGGTAQAHELTPEEHHAAVLAARTLGLGVAGVDLVESRRGPLVLEVNSSPGLEGIERVTGADVATPIIGLVEVPSEEPASA